MTSGDYHPHAARLAEHLRARRAELGEMSHQDVAREGGPGREMQRQWEAGRVPRKRLRGDVIRRYERALAWKEGSIRAILRGEEPQESGEAIWQVSAEKLSALVRATASLEQTLGKAPLDQHQRSALAEVSKAATEVLLDREQPRG